jgi:hypothetical protein
MASSMAVVLMASMAGAVTVTVEAESAVEVEAPMALVTNSVMPQAADIGHTASGGAWLSIPEGAGNPPKVEKGFARFEVDVPAAGGYYIWARVRWDGECSNSFTLKVDDGAPVLFGEDPTFGVWHWVRYPVSRMAKAMQLDAGSHAVVFRNREDGVAIDQLILATDKRFTPVGIMGDR